MPDPKWLEEDKALPQLGPERLRVEHSLRLAMRDALLRAHAAYDELRAETPACILTQIDNHLPEVK